MLRRIIMAGICAGAIGVIVTGPGGAVATHEPADKTAATASSIDEVNDSTVLLEETMRVSSTSDLILSTAAECTILTELSNPGSATGGASDTQSAFGQVELFIEIDGRRVPVSTPTANDSDPDTNEGDNGEVTFCNRAYARRITDREENEGGAGGGDGYDEESDFIRTRTANAFNWMAFNVGKEYDVDGDNVVKIVLRGRFTKQANGETSGDCDNSALENPVTPAGVTCADAFVGARSLIIEAVHASNHEAAAPVDDGAEDTDGGTSVGGVSLP